MTYTDEQLIQMSQGVDVMGVTGKPAEVPAEPAPEAEFDEVVETTEEVIVEGDTVEEQKPMNRTQKRITQLNEKAKQAEARAQQLEIELQRREFELEQKQAALNKLLAGTKENETDAEVLDEVLDKKLSGKIEKLEGEIERSKLEARLMQEVQVGQASFPDYGNAESYLIAHNANIILNRAAMVNHKLTNEQAIAMAHQSILEEADVIARHNKKVGSIAEYVYNMAKQYGFSASKKGEEAKIDMKAVQRVRDEAGAPTIQKEPVIQGGAQWRSQVEKMAKAGGASDDALARALGKRSY